MDLVDIVGKSIFACSVDQCKEQLVIWFTDGSIGAWKTVGDCCSHSWIEHFTCPDNVRGALITDAQDLGLGEITDPDHECLKAYQTVIKTTRGDVIMEYRNSSNGYYGGYLEADLYVEDNPL